MPLAESDFTVSRMVMRLTCISSASKGSAGRISPGANLPEQICSPIWFRTCRCNVAIFYSLHHTYDVEKIDGRTDAVPQFGLTRGRVFPLAVDPTPYRVGTWLRPLIGLTRKEKFSR